MSGKVSITKALLSLVGFDTALAFGASVRRQKSTVALLNQWISQFLSVFPAIGKPSTNITRMNEWATRIREFVVLFVDGFLNLPQRFLRGLQSGMTQARVNLDGAAGQR